MIRLRRAIDRGLANRWLRILLLIVFVGLLALVIFHGTSDAIADGAVAGCLAVIVLVFLIVVPRVPVRDQRRDGPGAGRSPPRVGFAPAAASPLARTVSAPLRR